MKKTYQKPEIFIEKITLNRTFLLEMSGDTKADSSVTPLTKDRGDYEVEEEPSFGDLW